ncbi:hypothetical protein GVN16_14675 [Emticicia sp. CRIBPO]|uniref:hypothetical protein n=1 Tax=Emticicia sp. CRIBPO TaxID=2683258 RepID=UPI00141359EF|nr:hypothetical protein [Emticicia sp. CRIBPO]NBA87014.1 hypothetical protein [Emticicia sp. CRIBPO]
MKKLFLIAVICLAVSCKKENTKPDPVEEIVPEKPQPKTLVKKIKFHNVSDKKQLLVTTTIELFYKENTSIVEKATRTRTSFSSDGKITSSFEEIMTFKHNEDDLIRSSVFAPNPPNSTSDPIFSEYIYKGKQLDYSTNSVGFTQYYKYDAKGNIVTIIANKNEYYYTYNDRTLTEGKYYTDRGTHFFEFSKYKNPLASLDPIVAGFAGLIFYGMVTDMPPVYLQANYLASKTYSPTPTGGSYKVVFSVMESKNDYPLKAEATGFTSNQTAVFEYEYLNL